LDHLLIFIERDIEGKFRKLYIMNYKPNSLTRTFIIILRLLVGGHLFFQGMIKLVSPTWTSLYYLENSSGIFHRISTYETFVSVINVINIWALILAGTALVIGIFEKMAARIGILLLSMYYLAYPPINLLKYNVSGEGQAFIVNATLIEIAVLVVLLLLPTGKYFGLSHLFRKKERNADGTEDEPLGQDGEDNPLKRRELLKSLGTIPVLGLFGFPFMQRRIYENIDSVTGASSTVLRENFRKDYMRLKNLDLDSEAHVLAARQKMPYGMIGDLKISRMISGSNLISMNMHPRDLDYVVSLAQNYNTEDRVLMTMKKMEEHGVNAIVLKNHNFKQFDLKKYWTEWGGKMKWIADPITSDFDKFEPLLVEHLELGASAAYIWGGSSDIWFHEGNQDYIAKALEIIKSYNIPAGIGAHQNGPIAFALKENLKPDFIFKTFHKSDYWSAHPSENYSYMEMYEAKSPEHNRYHDNLWCQHPEEMAEMIRNSDIPWIAFKTMAAGAIKPREGFDYAFENGADFLCVGMFDFQVEEDMAIFKDSYNASINRPRPWMG
jgi:uncharacterized membrane protein YphA (DoxX/SURF4 family)